MFRLICLLLLLFISNCGVAQETKSFLPPGVTKQNAADGWIALFDGETTYGWTIQGDAKVANKTLILGGENATRVTTNSLFSNFDLEYEFSGDNLDKIVIVLNQQKHGLSPRKPLPLMTLKGTLTVRTVPDGQTVEVGTDTGDNPLLGQTATRTFAKPYPGTSLSKIEFEIPAGAKLIFRSLKLKPFGTQPIFNGKDLTGWKEIPEKKSKYTVTPEGELNVKDGNGDIQTLDQWDDFILQLDVISNGDHLNSGVFFRCLPGVFWSGYEAQIRNEWQSTVLFKDGKSITGSLTDNGTIFELISGRNTTKLNRDEIESITHHREKPIDFGSGGIYHHCPSRRVITNDREYYTMTVIAHGNHIAVWVNGYQTAEFTDKRPENVNARRGRKDAKGCISIQGHDPTTDLSFKNLRILSLSKPTSTPVSK